MKRSIIAGVFCFVISQAALSQFRLGFTGSAVYSRATLNKDQQGGAYRGCFCTFDKQTSFGGIYSFAGGVVADLKITNEFSIKSKLLYINKGWKEITNLGIDTIVFSTNGTPPRQFRDEQTKSNEIFSLSYLELPVHFTFYTPVGKTILFLGVGPYVSYGLSGKYKYNVVQTNKHYRSDSTRTITFGNTKKNDAIYYANSIDYGASIETGLEFRNRLAVNFSFSAGLKDVVKDRYGALPNRYRLFTIGIMYFMKPKSRDVYK